MDFPVRVYAADAKPAPPHGTVVSEALSALAYGAVEAPTRAVCQDLDHLVGTQLEKPVVDWFKSFKVERPDPKGASTAVQWAQKIGRGIGCALPYTLSLGLVSGARLLLSEGNAVREFLSLGKATSTLNAAEREATMGALVGVPYSTLFHPADDPQGGSFAHQKLVNMIKDPAAFAAMGIAFPYLGRTLGATSQYVQSRIMLPPLAVNALRAGLEHPFVPNVASIAPGNAVGGEVAELLGSGHTPTTGVKPKLPKMPALPKMLHA
ncbi:MAG TPA: hypothetical protein V6D22_05060 [Candidatus Obscuribacterales bacterium]